MGCQLRMTEAVRWAHWRATGSPARRREHDNGALLTEKTVRVMLRAVAAASQKNEAQETTTTRKRADNEV